MAAVLLLMVPRGCSSPTRAPKSETRITPNTRNAFLPVGDAQRVEGITRRSGRALETILAGFVSKDAAIARSTEVTPWMAYSLFSKATRAIERR